MNKSNPNTKNETEEYNFARFTTKSKKAYWQGKTQPKEMVEKRQATIRRRKQNHD